MLLRGTLRKGMVRKVLAIPSPVREGPAILLGPRKEAELKESKSIYLGLRIAFWGAETGAATQISPLSTPRE